MSCDDLCFLRSRGRHCASAATLIASHLATHNTSVVSRPSRTSTLKSTKNNADTNWNANVDLFDKGVLAAVWYFTRQQGPHAGSLHEPHPGQRSPNRYQSQCHEQGNAFQCEREDGAACKLKCESCEGRNTGEQDAGWLLISV